MIPLNLTSKVVTDLICLATYLISFNSYITSSLFIFLSVSVLPSPSLVIISLAMLGKFSSHFQCFNKIAYLVPLKSALVTVILILISVWEISLLVCIGLANCLSLIRVTVAHGYTWIHEWSSTCLHAIFATICLLHVILVICLDLFKVIENLNTPTELGPDSLSGILLGRQTISIEDKADWVLSDYVLNLERIGHPVEYLTLATLAFLGKG